MALSQPHFPRPPSGGDQLATTCPAHIKPNAKSICFTCFIRKLRSFPMFFNYPHSPFIHHLFTILFCFPFFHPPTDRNLLPIPVRPGRPSRGWAAEDAFLRAGLLPSECIAGEGCSELGVQPSLCPSAIYPCIDSVEFLWTS